MKKLVFVLSMVFALSTLGSAAIIELAADQLMEFSNLGWSSYVTLDSKEIVNGPTLARWSSLRLP